MTEAERLAHAAIEKTLAACTQAGDARKADAYANSFTEDGVLELGEKIAGREAIRQWMLAPSVIPQPRSPQSSEAVATVAVTPRAVSPGFVSHHLTTCRIELTSESAATVRTYWLVMTAIGVDHSGYYDDRFRKVDDAWLLAWRRPRTLWTSPHSLLRPQGY